VKYHAGDLSRIWVLDAKEERYREVEAVNRTYTDGLSLWKHRVIRAYVREEMREGGESGGARRGEGPAPSRDEGSLWKPEVVAESRMGQRGG
jgi:hypothetical protein